MQNGKGHQAIDLTQMRFAYRSNRMMVEEQRARELVIEQGWRGYVAVSRALRDLSDRGGFLNDHDFRTFITQRWGAGVWEEFCTQLVFGLDKRDAYDADTVLDENEEMVTGTNIPTADPMKRVEQGRKSR